MQFVCWFTKNLSCVQNPNQSENTRAYGVVLVYFVRSKPLKIKVKHVQTKKNKHSHLKKGINSCKRRPAQGFYPFPLHPILLEAKASLTVILNSIYIREVSDQSQQTLILTYSHYHHIINLHNLILTLIFIVSYPLHLILNSYWYGVCCDFDIISCILSSLLNPRWTHIISFHFITITSTN